LNGNGQIRDLRKWVNIKCFNDQR